MKPVLAKKLHHYLIAGNVVIDAGEGSIQAVPTNAMIVSETRELAAHQIGKAQQALQIQLSKKLDDAPVKMVDVIITNLMYLGHMTSETFQARPQGVEVRERREGAEADNVVDLTAALADKQP